MPEGASKEGLWGVEGHSRYVALQHSRRAADDPVRDRFAGAVVSPSLDLGWRHVFGDVTPDLVHTMPEASFAVSGIPIAEDSLLIGVGLDALLPSTGWRTSLKYIGRDRRGRAAPYLLGRPRHPVLRPSAIAKPLM